MDNLITKDQWQKLVSAAQDLVESSNLPQDTLYKGTTYRYPRTRYSLYDNYDRWGIPGLDFVISDNDEKGKLTVYDGSEMAYAPITFDEGMKIASNMFNEYGGQMAEEIVVEYVDSKHPRIRLFG